MLWGSDCVYSCYGLGAHGDWQLCGARVVRRIVRAVARRGSSLPRLLGVLMGED